VLIIGRLPHDTPVHGVSSCTHPMITEESRPGRRILPPG
jgi:hypothetical protein